MHVTFRYEAPTKPEPLFYLAAEKTFVWPFPWLPRKGDRLIHFFEEHGMDIIAQACEEAEFHKNSVTITIKDYEDYETATPQRMAFHCHHFIEMLTRYKWKLVNITEEWEERTFDVDEERDIIRVCLSSSIPDGELEAELRRRGIDVQCPNVEMLDAAITDMAVAIYTKHGYTPFFNLADR